MLLTAARSTLLAMAVALSLTGLPSEPSSSASAPSFPIHLVHRGELTRSDYERVIEHPFEVPAGATRLEVTLEQTGTEERTVIDLGLRGPTGLRGWSGSRQTRVDVSTLTATPGYLPGPIEPGQWAVLLGIANIREQRRDTYTISIIVDNAPLMPTRVVNDAPGWYAGDLHTHSGHSDGRGQSARGLRVPVPPHRVFDRARAADLNFVLLSDHNTASHWLDVDRLQPFYDDLLLLHGREVTTYRGHANTVGEGTFVTFYQPSPRDTTAAVLRGIADTGAFVSINHPLLPDDERCMGCGWNDATRDELASVHGVEVINGRTRSGPQWGWPFWAQLLNRGFRLTAVGGSDDHTPDDIGDGVAGTPTTVVWASALSENAILEGLKTGRVYVRTQGVDGPHVDVSARFAGTTYHMGDEIPARAAGELVLIADLERAAGQQLAWMHNATLVRTDIVANGRIEFRTRATPGDWFSVVLRSNDDVTALSNAIYFGARTRH